MFSYQNTDYLSQQVAWITFANPVWLSAGFDKDGQMVNLMADIWFSYTQVWSVTHHAYEGNPRPRSLRLLPSQWLLVNYGLKNHGIATIIQRITADYDQSIPLSFSVAKTNCRDTVWCEDAIADYIASLRAIQESGLASMITLNISCPNTFGGEPFTTPELLDQLLTAVDGLDRDVPMYVKMPIDVSWEIFQWLLDVIIDHQLTGVIIGNLKKDRAIESLIDTDRAKIAPYGWWVSGKPTEATCNHLISETYQYAGDQLIIVGVGGIFSAADAYDKIKRWATLVQLITGMIYRGPQLISEINRWLVQLMKEDGYSNISEVVGLYHK